MKPSRARGKHTAGSSNFIFRIAQSINTHDWFPQVGDKVSIYWKGDKKWYSGTVFRPIASQPGVFRIKFDDGTTDNFKYDPAKWRKIIKE
jgi:hypothetical protein